MMFSPNFVQPGIFFISVKSGKCFTNQQEFSKIFLSCSAPLMNSSIVKKVRVLKILTKKTFLEISVKILLCFLVKNQQTIQVVMSRSQTEGKLTVKNKPNYGINSLENTLRLTFLNKIPGCQKRGVAALTQQPAFNLLLFSSHNIWI